MTALYRDGSSKESAGVGVGWGEGLKTMLLT
jgi:hypothetical protein